MWRTISMGHSSRSSNSISTSSGSFFFAKSRRDFKLSFKVLAVIMVHLLFGRNTERFAGFAREFGQELQKVIDHANIGDLEDRRFRVLVDRDDERISLESRQMLESTAD